MRPNTSGTKFLFASEQLKKQDEIGEQTEKRILKSSGFVFLEEEMPRPGETISNDRHQPK